MIDTTGKVAVSYTYDPWGFPTTTLNAAATTNASTATVNAAAQVAAGNPIVSTSGAGTTGAAPGPGEFFHVQGYATGIWDETTGLLKLGQRYLNTTTGSFTQQDSITQLGNPGNGNRYAYAADSPFTYIDPAGLDPIGDFMGYVAGYVAVGGVVAAWQDVESAWSAGSPAACWAVGPA